jgi:biopolymer transport protein ExbD
MSDEGRPRPGKKKHRKAEAEADPEFQIAPMIDILLVLLVFFMSISSTEVLRQNQNVDLPVAKEAKEPKTQGAQKKEVVINVLYIPISNTTSIEIDEKSMTAQQMIPVLQAAVQRSPQVRVLLRVDKQVRYEFLRSMLESIGQSGVSDVTFSVVDKDPKANPPKS